MTEQEKVRLIIDTLERLYPEPSIPLRHQDPYTLLIAVLLSAQSTDVRVNQITPALFQRADTPEKMVRLSTAAIESVIRPCGLGRRKSRAIWQLSHILLEEHAGNVPQEMEALERLPGVGHKTASVIMAQAFGEATFPVDTHIHRLLHRWGLSSGKHVGQTEADGKRLFPPHQWNKLHLQLIFFGREYCPARGHAPNACPLCSKIGCKTLLTAIP